MLQGRRPPGTWAARSSCCPSASTVRRDCRSPLPAVLHVHMSVTIACHAACSYGLHSSTVLCTSHMLGRSTQTQHVRPGGREVRCTPAPRRPARRRCPAAGTPPCPPPAAASACPLAATTPCGCRCMAPAHQHQHTRACSLMCPSLAAARHAVDNPWSHASTSSTDTAPPRSVATPTGRQVSPPAGHICCRGAGHRASHRRRRARRFSSLGRGRRRRVM